MRGLGLKGLRVEIPGVLGHSTVEGSRSRGLGGRSLGLKRFTPWCLVGNGGMDIGDDYRGLYRDYTIGIRFKGLRFRV